MSGAHIPHVVLITGVSSDFAQSPAAIALLATTTNTQRRIQASPSQTLRLDKVEPIEGFRGICLSTGN